MENKDQQSQPELSISDLQNIRTLLDVATRRGAFGASEMTSVGAVFDRLNNFLMAVTPPAADDANTEKTQ